MREGTRYGSPVHHRTDVRDPDAYTRPTDGKIKAARRGRSVGRKEGNDQRLGTMCAGARKPAGSRKSLQIQAGAHLALGP
jgi:hypothetical protein